MSSDPTPTPTTDRAAAFERLRPKLQGIAYRMLGSTSEAEDIVQEAWLRLKRTTDVRSIDGLLVRVTTRLCLDREKALRRSREEYVGPWLPEPIDTEPSPEAETERMESISLALLHLLDTLPPLERAVFLLREVLDYDYAEVARIVDRRVDHCRQIARRARRHLQSDGGQRSVDPEEHRTLLEAFLRATQAGDLERLEGMLHDDVVLLADSGGKVVAALNPLVGPNTVGRFLVGIASKAPADLQVSMRSINGLPAAVLSQGVEVIAVFSLDIREGRVFRVFSVRNPDKLARLRP